MSASNALLNSAYWRGAGTTSFAFTVRNTGSVAAAVRVDYTVPDGVSDAATGACAHGHCSVPSVAPDASLTLPVAIVVSPDAWRHPPLVGRFTVTARAAGAKVGDARGTWGTWGVLFPSGPPAAGIDLRVDDVTLGAQPDVPGRLRISLTNTGALPAAAALDVVLPRGVGTGPLPVDCARQRSPDPAAARCLPGTLAPAEQKSIVVPLTVDAAARADTPLTGLVRATLTATGQPARTAQEPYQVLVPVSLSGVTAQAVAPVVSVLPPLGGGATTLDAGDAMAWPLVAGGTAVLIGLIWGLMLRRRGRPDSGALAATPTATHPAAPIAMPAGWAGPARVVARPGRRGGGGARPSEAETVLMPALRGEVRPDRPGLPAPVGPVAGGPPEGAVDPAEMIAELAAVAAELAEVAALLGGEGSGRGDRTQVVDDRSSALEP
ncbi:COG1361 family protein [Rugosimonospora acidiphila]|uniref:hypothetical protein n=1 Tax=Rugosimonospora acidiphila TaxID=556531 RepID=UPI0031F15C40